MHCASCIDSGFLVLARHLLHMHIIYNDQARRLTVRIPPFTQFTLISLGPSRTRGPSRLWAARTVEFSLPRHLVHNIQAGLNDEVG